jgi:hypothetical protein
VSDTKPFLRDLALLLGLPALAIGIALVLWRPWEDLPWQTHPVSEPIFQARDSLERHARAATVRESVWEGLLIQVPQEFVLTVDEPILEALEEHPYRRADPSDWSAQMAFLHIDSAAASRFADAATNCDLAPGRCWTEQAGSHTLDCHRSAGVPDPQVPWTPHVECHVQSRRVRVLINAPASRTEELLGVFRDALIRPLPAQRN